MPVVRPFCLLLIVSLLSACASAPPRSAADAVAVTATTWVERSSEYRALVAQVYRQAIARVDALADGRGRGEWGVVLDADETVISNLAYQLEREAEGLSYTADSWRAWVGRREATPLPGAAAFLDRVRALGGRIAIVTNRLGSECDDTEAVFREHLLDFDVMLCRPDGESSDKNARFAMVADGAWPGASGPIEILVFVGDNILDFPGMAQQGRNHPDDAFNRFGADFFLVPNPMYGSWAP